MVPEFIILVVIISFLLGFIVFIELLHYKERDSLTKKIMSRDFVDYSGAELAMAKHKSKPASQPEQSYRL